MKYAVIDTVQWECKCGVVNWDDYQETAMPMCSWCGKCFLWDELLSPEQMTTLNIEVNP